MVNCNTKKQCTKAFLLIPSPNGTAGLMNGKKIPVLRRALVVKASPFFINYFFKRKSSRVLAGLYFTHTIFPVFNDAISSPNNTSFISTTKLRPFEGRTCNCIFNFNCLCTGSPICSVPNTNASASTPLLLHFFWPRRSAGMIDPNAFPTRAVINKPIHTVPAITIVIEIIFSILITYKL